MDATFRIQSNSGTVDPAAGSFTATLPNGTALGSTLLLHAATATSSIPVPAADPPWFLDEVHAAVEYVFRRADQPAGETSWTFSLSTGTARFAWYVEEWAGMSGITQPDSSVNSQVSPATPISDIGVQANNSSIASPNQCSPDVTDYLARAVFRASAGTAIWPLRTYSSGWAEVACVSVGDGTHTGVAADFQLMIAESYPGTTGVIDCTMTWDTSNGGTYADKTVDVWVAAYQPAPVAPPAGILTA